MTTQIVATRLNGEDRARDGGDGLAQRCWRCWRCWLLPAATARRSGAAGRKGAAPTGRHPVRRRAAARRLAVAGWGLAALLLLPHLTLLLVSFVPVGTWTTEPLPPAYTLRNYVDAGAGPGAGAAAAEQPLARDRRDRRRRGDRAGGRAASVLGARVRCAPGHRGSAGAALGGARAPSSRSRWPRPSACTRRWAGRVRPGRHPLDPSARVSRTESADHEPRDLSPACAPSILRWTRPRPALGRGALAQRCGG